MLGTPFTSERERESIIRGREKPAHIRATHSGENGRFERVLVFGTENDVRGFVANTDLIERAIVLR